MSKRGAIFALCGLIAALAATGAAAEPITIERQGSFAAGGRVAADEKGATLSCDHGFVEYQIPVKPRRVSLFMWHSSSTKVWQTRWDGGEGYQSIFLRRGFPVYLWDGPRVGRGNWGCDAYGYKPWIGRDQQNFVSWRFGAKYPEWFPGVQFPTADAEAWDQAKRARYAEFDTVENAQLESDAAAKAIDRIGPSVLLTNSAGGLRALLTALKSDNVKGIVAYETPGLVFPSDVDAPKGAERFGPVIVSPEEFRKLTRIPIQLVYGDFLDRAPSWAEWSRNAQVFADLVNARGGKAEVLHLPAAGLKGNTHIPFADLNNVAVADLLSSFLKQHKLDDR